MRGAATPAGLSPEPRRDGDEADDLRAVVAAEPLPASEDEIADAFSAVAALLLDWHAARRSQGASPTPICAPLCPDPPHARGLPPPQHEGAGP
jgi:hypothetical protein